MGWIVKYADVLLSELDAAHLIGGDDAIVSVLKAYHWRFTAGAFSDEPLLNNDNCCMIEFPNGTAAEIAKRLTGERLSVAEAKSCPPGAAAALRLVLANRRSETPPLNFKKNAELVLYVSKIMRGIVADDKPVYLGMKAYSEFMTSIMDNCGTAAVINGNKRKFVSEFTEVSSLASRHSAADARKLVQESCDIVNSSFLTGIKYCVAAVNVLKGIMFGGRTREAAAKCMRNEEDDPRVTSIEVCGLKVYVSWKRALFKSNGKWCLMGDNDINRVMDTLESIIFGVRGAVTTLLESHHGRPKATASVEAHRVWLKVLFAHMSTLDLGDEHQSVMLARKVKAYAYAKVAGPLCRAKAVALRTEALLIPNSTDDIVDELVDVLPRTSINAFLDVLNFNKIFPVGDVCPAWTLTARAAGVHHQNVFDPGFEDRFRTSVRTQLLRAFIRSPNGRSLPLRDATRVPAWYGDYENGRYPEVTSSEIDEYLAWEGRGEIRTRKDMDPASWKDSSIPFDTFEQCIDPQSKLNRNSRAYRNQIVRLIKDDEIPRPSKKHRGGETVTELLCKIEPHKTPMRATFSQDIDTRQEGSPLEEATGDILKHHPSYAIGSSAETQRAREVAFLRPPASPDMQALYYSFDISGWSEKAPGRPQMIVREEMDKLHGGTRFVDFARKMHGTRVFMNDQGFIGWYINTTSNMEGIDGKLMTIINLALADMSVEDIKVRLNAVLAENGLRPTAVAALVQVYIDDGLARIDVRRDIAELALETTESSFVGTYGHGGFIVVPMKSYPSDRFFIFLNEIYFAGRKIPQGSRAAYSIRSEILERHWTIQQMASKYMSNVRGSVISGLGATTAMILLGDELYELIKKRTVLSDPRAMVVYAFQPVAWRGLGCPYAALLATIGAGAAMEESMHVIATMAEKCVITGKYYVRRVREGLEKRGAESIVSSPLGGKLPGPNYSSNPGSKLVRKSMMTAKDNSRLSSMAEKFLAWGNDSSYKDYCNVMLSKRAGAILQEQIIADVGQAHPFSIYLKFIGLIEKSSSLLHLTSSKAVNGLERENLNAEHTASVEFVESFYGAATNT